MIKLSKKWFQVIIVAGSVIIIAVVILFIIDTNRSQPAPGGSMEFPLINPRIVEEGEIGQARYLRTMPDNDSANTTPIPTATSIPDETVVPPTPVPTGTPTPTPTPTPTQTKTPTPQPVPFPQHKFPRIANYYLMPKIGAGEVDELAKYDLLITMTENQTNNPDILIQLREKNPDIIILAYVNLSEFPAGTLDINEGPGGLFHLMQRQIPNSWYLYDQTGANVEFWPGQLMMNVTTNCPNIDNQQWGTYLGNFMLDRVISSGLWDGVFFDNAWPAVAWLNNGNIDSNNDGRKDNATELNQAWFNGTALALQHFNNNKGPHIFHITNGGYQYYPYINGNMFEAFPRETQAGDPAQTRDEYLKALDAPNSKGLVVIATEASTRNDLQTIRFGLATTLLGNGYSAADRGPTKNHDQIWWYPEYYEVDLGLPISDAFNYANGVWRRDYQKGIALANFSGITQGIRLEASYQTTGGDRVSEIVIGANDGLILKR